MQAAPEVAGARCTLLGRPPPDALLGASCVPPLAASVAQRMVGAVETRPTRRQRWRDASETVFLPKARALTRFVATTPRLGRLSVILIALTVALAMVAAWLAIQLLD